MAFALSQVQVLRRFQPGRVHAGSDLGEEATPMGDRAGRSNQREWRRGRDNAAIPFQGRAVPVAWVDFEYPWKKVDPPSQNTIERYLLTWLGLAVPRGARLILIFDRGYARVELIKDLNRGQQPFLIRARRQVIVQAKVQGPPAPTEFRTASFSHGPSEPPSPRPLP
jgi:hypothetical protein